MSEAKRPPANILTIDVEEWYHMNFPSADALPAAARESRVERNLEALLSILDERGAKATFFFLGSVAEERPALVRAVEAQGHEIASHGYGHGLVSRQGREEFRADVERSLRVLRGIAARPVKGYRAPSWSISRETPWVYEVLLELGLEYSSSLFPFTTYLYGDSRAPVAPFAALESGGRRLREVPASVLDLRLLRIPFGGGFYFRVLPLWATRLAARIANRRGRPAMFYLHPREIDPRQPRLDLSARDRFVAYAGLAGTARKLRKLLAAVPTTTIAAYLDWMDGLD